MRGRFLAALGMWSLTAAFASAATPKPPQDPNDLVARLGSEEFGEREAAVRQLEHLGEASLPALRSASTSSDPEIRRRAAPLIERIERAAESARFLEVGSVSLHYDRVPLGTAVLDFRARTKIPVLLDPNGVADPLRPVTVKADDLSPWEAFEAFCKAAGVKEVFASELAPPKPTPHRYGRGGLALQGALTPPLASTVPVVLADGSYASLSGERAGAVRVLALPHGFAGNRRILGTGEVTLHLDVAPLPGQNWQDVVSVRVRKALDAQGRSVPVSHRVEVGPSLTEISDGNVMILNGRMAMWNQADAAELQVPRPNPRLMPITLRTGDTGIRSLSLLEGDIQVELALPRQTLLTVANLDKAAKTTVDGPNLHRLTILDVFHEPKRPDQTTIKLRLDSPSPWMMQQIKMQGRMGNMMPGLVMFDGITPPTPPPEFQVYRADGQVLTTTSTAYNNGQSDDGMMLFSEMTVTVRSASPAKLVMIGPKTVTVDVPFRMEGVPLP